MGKVSKLVLAAMFVSLLLVLAFVSKYGWTTCNGELKLVEPGYQCLER